MSKKKYGKHAKRNLGAGYGNGYVPEGWGASYGSEPINGGLLHNLHGLMGSRRAEQFILGALIGAAAVYVLGDEKLRGKLIKAGIGLYTGIAGGFEEMKEQMADLKAEAEAEGHGAP